MPSLEGNDSHMLTGGVLLATAGVGEKIPDSISKTCHLIYMFQSPEHFGMCFRKHGVLVIPTIKNESSILMFP